MKMQELLNKVSKIIGMISVSPAELYKTQSSFFFLLSTKYLRTILVPEGGLMESQGSRLLHSWVFGCAEQRKPLAPSLTRGMETLGDHTHSSHPAFRDVWQFCSQCLSKNAYKKYIERMKIKKYTHVCTRYHVSVNVCTYIIKILPTHVEISADSYFH